MIDHFILSYLLNFLFHISFIKVFLKKEIEKSQTSLKKIELKILKAQFLTIN